ncbi:MerR family transcriptional regulator [Abyssicoccus albus]|uniref:MerR family transcriptional regulator n=1 Tax=Abyssicoccus albus TaxID=1817405 RepID=UPI00097E32A8|nr:MerR family transcriptional regulator [Abyssicoccus albus]AQL55606.1 MerR family transcriptional regulator [Abyssicoccus albus]
MHLQIKEVSKIAGVSVRTLQYYDQIDLLSPEKSDDNGYRMYSKDDLDTLQQILFFKEIGFKLKEIKNFINNPTYNQYEALILQRRLLDAKRIEINRMISTIDKTLKHLKGEASLTHIEKFEGLKREFDAYTKEAHTLWGKNIVDTYQTKLNALSNTEKISFSKKWDYIFEQLASYRYESPNSKEVQKLINDWFHFLNTHFTDYSLDAFKGLGQLYDSDTRYKKYIDQYGEGLTTLMIQAIDIYVNIKRKEDYFENKN